jgi:hypothetical protein
MASRTISCSSAGSSICMNTLTQVVAPGYYCQTDLCFQCPVGYYGTDGKTCCKCDFAKWSEPGSSSCYSQIKYTKPALVKAYIPYGVTKINVRLWGGGGGGDSSRDNWWLANSGGGGAFATCNVTVRSDSDIYITVAGGGVYYEHAEFLATGGKFSDDMKHCHRICSSCTVDFDQFNCFYFSSIQSMANHEQSF